SGKSLYSNNAPLVCDTHAQVGLWQVSPDGHWIAYLNNSTHTLRLVRSDATQDHQITLSAGDVQSLVWTPDSQHLIFAQSDPQHANAVTFWSVDSGAKQPQKLAVNMTSATVGIPVVSPDGQTVAVTMKSSGSNSLFTFSMHPSDQNVANDAIIAA